MINKGKNSNFHKQNTMEMVETSRSVPQKHTKNMYLCNQLHCDQTDMSHDQYVLHMEEMHNISKAFDCVECGQRFKTWTYLNRHLELHTSDLKYICSVCGLQYKRQSGLDAHMKYKHSIKEKHQCLLCGQSFVEMSKLKRHMIHKHSEAALFKCAQCGKKLASKDSLKFHERIHNNEKPFVCPECEKGFRSKSDLNKHRVTHSEFKAYQCKICLKSFQRKDVVKAHLKTKHYVAIPASENFAKQDKDQRLKWEDFFVSCASNKCRRQFKIATKSVAREQGDTQMSIITDINECTMITSPSYSEHRTDNLTHVNSMEPCCTDKGEAEKVGCVMESNEKQSSLKMVDVTSTGISRSNSSKIKTASKINQISSPSSNTDLGSYPLVSKEMSTIPGECLPLTDTDSSVKQFPNVSVFHQNVKESQPTTKPTQYNSCHLPIDSANIALQTKTSPVRDDETFASLQKLPVNIIDKLESVIENSQGSMNSGLATCISGTLEHSLGGPASLIGSYTGGKDVSNDFSRPSDRKIKVFILPSHSLQDIDEGGDCQSLVKGQGQSIEIHNVTGSGADFNAVTDYTSYKDPSAFESGFKDLTFIEAHQMAIQMDHGYFARKSATLDVQDACLDLSLPKMVECVSETVSTENQETIRDVHESKTETVANSKPKRKQTLTFRSDVT